MKYLLKITYLSLFTFKIYHKELRTLFFIVTTIKQTGQTRWTDKTVHLLKEKNINNNKNKNKKEHRNHISFHVYKK